MDAEFEKLIKDLKDYLLSKPMPLGGFTVNKPVKIYAKIKDHKKMIGNDIAHYEIKKMGKNISVEIHFEAVPGKSDLKDIFHEKIILPKNLEWIDWYASKSIRHNVTIDINDTNKLEEISNRLLYFETSGLAGKIRELL